MEHVTFHLEDEKWDAPHFVDFRKAHEDFNEATSVEDYFFGQPLPKTGTSNKMRRSLSNGNLVMFSEQKCLLLQEPTCKVIKEDEQTTGEFSKTRSKSVSKGSVDQLHKGAHPRYYGSHDNLKKLNENKFVSMAEQISMFQNRTPERFRVKPPVHTKVLQKTVPESPALTTKLRARPDQHKVLSHEQRELIEFHNLQKCKIKANPVNKKVLQGLVKALVPIEKKPPTVPVPFKLTEVPPKQTVPSPKKYVFHANPILKASPKRTSVTAPRATTKPITPTFMKNYKPPMRSASVGSEKTATVNSEGNKPRMTKPEPFSFAARDKFVSEKREKLIQKILEEEKRAREFHANPVPKSIYKSGSKRSSIESVNSTKKGSSMSSSEDVSTNFKARPAKVLQKKPFMPAPSGKEPTVPEPFELESERRRLERLTFEEQQRERMETLRSLELEREELKKAAEKEEIARIRKLAETKARPVPNYKSVNIQPSKKPLTEPKSPNLGKMNKENVPSYNY